MIALKGGQTVIRKARNKWNRKALLAQRTPNDSNKHLNSAINNFEVKNKSSRLL